MTGPVCVDSSIVVKIVTPENGSSAASVLAQDATALYAPPFAWAEVGSTLRKKVRLGFLDDRTAEQAWEAFGALGVIFVHSEAIKRRAWDIARDFALPTLYDAGFLAVAELAPGGPMPYWTADYAFVERLAGLHPLVHALPSETP